MAISTAKAENYRRLAADLRRQAAEAISPDIKQDLMVLAEQYDRLAGQRMRAVNATSHSRPASVWQSYAVGD
jgi:hypothetical protein